MREIIFDTETTGIGHQEGHRIIEIGAIEMVDRIPTGRTFHKYLDPEDKEVEPGAFNVHGLSNERLKGEPFFRDILPEFLEFFGEGILVAHNASFDIGFFNAELDRVEQPPIDPERVVDTLAIARRKFPGGKNSLDNLCSRFGISNAHRKLHGALLDSELLADVYIELTGGKQVALGLDDTPPASSSAIKSASPEKLEHPPQRQRPIPLPHRLKPADFEAHEALLSKMKATPLWRKWQELEVNSKSA